MMAFFIISIVQLALVSILYLVSFWIGATVGNGGSVEKQSAYECGLEPIGDARTKFEVLYYVIGILYLIFDQEIIFLFPLASIMFSLNSQQAFWLTNIFQIIVTTGFIYEYTMGAQDIT